MNYRLYAIIVLIMIIISTSGCKPDLRQKIIECMISINNLTFYF
jgi:hypothetical protein